MAARLPKISVITPSFNQGRFIGETIESVLGQGYPDLEYFVIDGGSTDETVEVVRSYGSRIDHFVSEKDRGQSDALNKGFARATGDLLTWVNSDDMLAPGALAAVAAEWQRSGADMIAGVVRVFSETLDKVVYLHTTSVPSGALPLAEVLDIDGHWLKGAFFYQPEVVFSRRILDLAGGAVDPSLFYSMDFDLWARFAASGAKFVSIDHEIARFRVHAAQKTIATERYVPELRQHAMALRRRFGIGEPASPSQPGEAATASDRAGETPAPRPVRIGMLSDYGFSYGAGRAHGRIAQALARSGFEVVASKFAEGVGQEKGADLALAAKAFAHAKVDAIILGNLHGVLPAGADLTALSEAAPLLVVTHDHWWLTGRCAYPMSCDRHLFACDAGCPTRDEYPALPAAAIGPAHAGKLLQLANPRVHLAANSAYMREQVRRGLAAQHRVVGADATQRLHRVVLGIAEEDFEPLPRAEARAKLEIGLSDFVVLAGATALDDRRKGFSHILAACEDAGRARVRLVLMGYVDPAHRLPGVIYTGYLTDNAAICAVFSAADVFIGASLDETFGQVFIEAAACGCPSIGYDSGGIADALIEGETGWLIPRGDVAAVGALLARLVAEPGLAAAMGARARIYADSNFRLPSIMRSLLPILRAMVGPEVPVPQALQFDGGVRREIAWLRNTLWSVISGYDTEEGPYPQFGIARRLRWQTAEVGRLEVFVVESGRCSFAIDVGNLIPDQEVTVTVAGQALPMVVLPAFGWDRVVRLMATLELEAGPATLELRAGKGQAGAEGRSLRLALFSLELVRGDGSALSASEAAAGVTVQERWLTGAQAVAGALVVAAAEAEPEMPAPAEPPPILRAKPRLPVGPPRWRAAHLGLSLTPLGLAGAGEAWAFWLVAAAGPGLRCRLALGQGPDGLGEARCRLADQEGEFALALAAVPPGTPGADGAGLRLALTEAALSEALASTEAAVAVFARLVMRTVRSALLAEVTAGMARRPFDHEAAAAAAAAAARMTEAVLLSDSGTAA